MKIYRFFRMKYIETAQSKKRMHLILLCFILLLGAGLRIYKLGVFSFWYDEAMAMLNSNKIAEIAKGMGGVKFFAISKLCSTHVLYLTFVDYWKYFGNSDFILRLSSVIFGTGSILAIFYLGKFLLNKKAGLISAFILAISPFHIYYSQELRMYTILSFLTIMSVYFLRRALKNGEHKFWVGYVSFNILSVYLHFMAFLILLAEIIFFLLYWKRYKHLAARWLMSHFAILLFLIPWLISVIFRLKIIVFRGVEGNMAWVPAWLESVSIRNLFFTFKNFSIGYNATLATYLFAFTLFFLLFLWGIFSIKKKKQELVLLLCCLFIPVFAMFLISKFMVCYVDRYVISSSIFYYLIIAGGISRIKKKYAAVFILVILILSILALKNYYRGYLPGSFIEHVGVQKKKEHRDTANYIMENLQKGDIVFHTSRNTTESFKYYFNVNKDKYSGKYENGAFDNLRKGDILRFDTGEDKLSIFEYDGERLDPSFVPRADISVNGKRIWLIFSNWDFSMAIRPDSLESKILKRMDEDYMRVSSRKFDGITVYLFTSS